MWRACIVLLIGPPLFSAGCIDSRADSGWPCDATRPCDTGYRCSINNVCVETHSFEPSLSPDTSTQADSSVADASTGPDVCVPVCLEGQCGNDGCGGTCGPCPIAVAETIPITLAEPGGLAVSPSGLLVADRLDGVVWAITSTAQTATAWRLPGEGALVDMTWDPVRQQPIVLTRLPARIVALADDGSTTTLAELPAEAVALSYYNTLFFTVENGRLVRRSAKTLEWVRETILAGDCGALAIRDGVGIQWCEATGLPGHRVHRFASIDAADPIETKVLDTVDVALDATEMTSMTVSTDGLWLLGRGYGQHASALNRVVIP